MDGEYDLKTLGELVLSLKRDYPDADDASVLLQPDIPYDDLIQVMDVVRSVELPANSELVAALAPPAAGSRRRPRAATRRRPATRPGRAAEDRARGAVHRHRGRRRAVSADREAEGFRDEHPEHCPQHDAAASGASAPRRSST